MPRILPVRLQPVPKTRGPNIEQIASDSAKGAYLFADVVQQAGQTAQKLLTEWGQYQDAENKTQADAASLQGYYEVLQHAEALKSEGFTDPDKYREEFKNRSESTWANQRETAKGAGVERFKLAETQYKLRLDLEVNNHARSLHISNGRAGLERHETITEAILRNPAMMSQWPKVIKDHKAAIKDSPNVGFYSTHQAEEMMGAFDASSSTITRKGYQAAAEHGEFLNIYNAEGSHEEKLEASNRLPAGLAEPVRKRLTSAFAADKKAFEHGQDVIFDETMLWVETTDEEGRAPQQNEIPMELEPGRRRKVEQRMLERDNLARKGVTDPGVYDYVHNIMTTDDQGFMELQLHTFLSSGPDDPRLDRNDHGFFFKIQKALRAGDKNAAKAITYPGVATDVTERIRHLEERGERDIPKKGTSGRDYGATKYRVNQALANRTQQKEARLTPAEVRETVFDVVSEVPTPIEIDWGFDTEKLLANMTRPEILGILQDPDSALWNTTRDLLVQSHDGAIPEATDIMAAMIMKYEAMGGEPFTTAEMKELFGAR